MQGAGDTAVTKVHPDLELMEPATPASVPSLEAKPAGPSEQPLLNPPVPLFPGRMLQDACELNCSHVEEGKEDPLQEGHSLVGGQCLHQCPLHYLLKLAMFKSIF